ERDALAHLRHDAQDELLGLGRKRHLPADRDEGRRPADLEVVREEHAARDLHVAVDAVEGEALAEDVAEVEHRAARQRLERDEPEELARTRLDLRELPAVRVQLEVAREAREREVVGIAGPHQRALEAAVAALEVVAVAEEPEERV